MDDLLQSATRYLMDYMSSIGLADIYLEQSDPFIGDLPLTQVDDESIAPYIKDKLKPGKTSEAWSNSKARQLLTRRVP